MLCLSYTKVSRADGPQALALFVVLRHLVRFENSAILWVDTTHDTHFERKLRAAHAAATVSHLPVDSAGTVDALDRFQIARADDAAAGAAVLKAATRVLDAQAAAHRARPGAPVLRTKMLVVDSITDLFAPELQDRTGHGRFGSPQRVL
jgi:hypothetical protein